VNILKYACVFFVIANASGCAVFSTDQVDGQDEGFAFARESVASDYLIGPGDNLSVFVWRHPEVSLEIPVRPDGKISSPLVEDLLAIGKTPTQLARDIENELATYIKQPQVTVMVKGFGEAFGQQIKVVGGGVGRPQVVRFREGMTLLDVVIKMGGLNEFSSGNNASILRTYDGKQQRVAVRLGELLEDGDMSQNIDVYPGDIVVIPESWF